MRILIPKTIDKITYFIKKQYENINYLMILKLIKIPRNTNYFSIKNSVQIGVLKCCSASNIFVVAAK